MNSGYPPPKDLRAKLPQDINFGEFGLTVYRESPQTDHKNKLRFRALLTDGAQEEVRFERVVGST